MMAVLQVHLSSVCCVGAKRAVSGWRGGLLLHLFLFALLAASGAEVRGGGVADALEQIDGIFLGRGVECPQFRTTTGEQISLTGVLLPQVAVGTQLHLTGTFIRISTCMQGRAFRVSELTNADPNGDVQPD